MDGEMIQFSHGAETYEGYLAKSASEIGAGIIVLQEWWGLVPHIKDVCDRFAAVGFHALAPDIYRGATTTDPSEAATLLQALNIAQTEQILKSAVDALLRVPGVSPTDKVGVVGFCMGGQLALFAAGLNPQIRAIVDYYGIHPRVQPNYAAFNGPTLGFFAEHDNSATPERVEALRKALEENGKEFEFKTYEGRKHAFFNDARPEVYDSQAASDSWQKMLAFFRRELA